MIIVKLIIWIIVFLSSGELEFFPQILLFEEIYIFIVEFLSQYFFYFFSSSMENLKIFPNIK